MLIWFARPLDPALMIRGVGCSRLVRSFIVAMPAVLSACGSPTGPSSSAPVGTEPVLLGDGWPVATLADTAIDAARMAALTDRISKRAFGLVDSLTIARDGRLCYDAYFNGDPSLVHELQSVTKSVTSALIGIAIARGSISDVHQAAAAVLPEYADAARDDAAKAAIRIEHLLTMSSGIDWDESLPITDPRNTLAQMNQSADWVGFVASRRAVETPGTRFVYNSGGVILLGAILRAATGQDVDQFAADNLFAPMDIRDARWSRNSVHPEQIHTGGGLSLRPRDQAKFGQLYLADGTWLGRRIVPPQWVRESTTPKLGAADGAQYGYLWWLRSVPGALDVAEAWGARGQHIFIVRPLNLVVVVNARDNAVDAGRQILSEVVAAASLR
jgi:CubicO group peptidase (beta-lactamase class C family)